MDGQCVAYLPDGAKARLDRFKFAWRLLLDTPSVPRGKAGDVETAAIKLAAGQSTFSAPLKPTQLVGVALFLEDVLDVTVEAAETVMEAAKAENVRRNDGRDRAGEATHTAFHTMLEKNKKKIRSVCTLLVDGERSDAATLHALPSDPTWPSARERQRASMSRELDELDGEDEHGFGPVKVGAPLKKGGKLIDY